MYLLGWRRHVTTVVPSSSKKVLWHSLGLRALVLNCAVALSFGQAPLRVNVNLVTTTVSVMDAQGEYLNQLTASDFIIEQNGVQREVVHLVGPDAESISIGVLLDVSGSMGDSLSVSTIAVERFLGQLSRTGNESFLMTFAARPQLAHEFTHDLRTLIPILRRLRATQSGELTVVTAVYDSIVAALRHISLGSNDKKAILLITDGKDSASQTTVVQLLRSPLLNNPIYTIGIGVPNSSATRRLSSQEAAIAAGLRQMSESSGGLAYLIAESDQSQLDGALQGVIEDLFSRYVISYYIADDSDDNSDGAVVIHTTGGHKVLQATTASSLIRQVPRL